MAQSLLLKLYIFMKELGFEFNNYDDEFLTRKMFQKKVYLLQMLGLNFGYKYNLYLHGPYSPGLTEDGYKILNYCDELDKKTEDAGLNEKGDVLKEHFNSILSKANEVGMSEVEWLELLTTLHYLYKNNTFTSINKNKTINRLKEIKPQFENEDTAIRVAWDIIIDLSGD